MEVKELTTNNLFPSVCDDVSQCSLLFGSSLLCFVVQGIAGPAGEL